MDNPIRGHTNTRNVAVLARQYYCAERKKQRIRPHHFNGFDKQVIGYSNDYVKMKWRTEGFVSHVHRLCQYLC